MSTRLEKVEYQMTAHERATDDARGYETCKTYTVTVGFDGPSDDVDREIVATVRDFVENLGHDGTQRLAVTLTDGPDLLVDYEYGPDDDGEDEGP